MDLHQDWTFPAIHKCRGPVKLPVLTSTWAELTQSCVDLCCLVGHPIKTMGTNDIQPPVPAASTSATNQLSSWIGICSAIKGWPRFLTRVVSNQKTAGKRYTPENIYKQSIFSVHVGFRGCISKVSCSSFVSLLSNPGALARSEARDKIFWSGLPCQQATQGKKVLRRHAHWALDRPISYPKRHISKMFTSKTSSLSISIVTRPLSLMIYAFCIWSLRNEIMHRISMFSPWNRKCPWNALYDFVYQYHFWPWAMVKVRASERPKGHMAQLYHYAHFWHPSNIIRSPAKSAAGSEQQWFLSGVVTAQWNPISTEMKSGLGFGWVLMLWSWFIEDGTESHAWQLIYFHGAPESTFRLNYQFHYLRTVLLIVYLRKKSMPYKNQEGRLKERGMIVWRCPAWSLDVWLASRNANPARQTHCHEDYPITHIGIRQTYMYTWYDTYFLLCTSQRMYIHHKHIIFDHNVYTYIHSKVPGCAPTCFCRLTGPLYSVNVSRSCMYIYI